MSSNMLEVVSQRVEEEGALVGGLSRVGLVGGEEEAEASIDEFAEKQMKQTEAIVHSMTKEERENPKLLNPSRKHRIAKGAGVDIAVVNRFIKQFEQSQKMMKQMPGLMKGLGKRGMRFPF